MEAFFKQKKLNQQRLRRDRKKKKNSNGEIFKVFFPR